MALEDYMTTREVAEALNMTPAKVTRAVQRGKFDGAVKKDWFWMVPRATVEKLKVKMRRARRSEAVSQAA